MLTLREVNAACFEYKVREWNHKNVLRAWRKDLALKCSKMFDDFEYLRTNRWTTYRWLYGHLTLEEQRKKAIERRDFEYAQACNHEPSKQ